MNSLSRAAVCVSVLLSLLLVAAGPQKLHAQGTLNGHPVRLDSSNKLLAWPATQETAYDQVLSLATSYLLNGVPNASNGMKAYYSHSYMVHTDPPTPADWPHNPAGLYAMLTDSGLLYYAYSGNSNMMNLVRDVLTFDLDHGLTPANWDWPSVPYASGDSNSLTYAGAAFGNSNGRGDGVGVIEPDKVGEIGVAFLKYYEFSGDTRFRDAAIQNANVLASHVRAGNATQSPWPFRVYAQTNVIREEYSAHVISPIALFDELIRLNLGDVAAYRAARQTAWNWLMTYPMQNNVWANYFEDIWIVSDTSNVNQLNAAETARYLLAHPEMDPDWQTHVQGIISWIESRFATPQNGANAIAEQVLDTFLMGSHTSRYGSLNAQFYERTGDAAAMEKAYRSLNWATYMCGSDGIVIDGPVPNGIWFTDGYGDYIKHFMEALGAVPEWAPPGQTHLLRSTSVVQNVQYFPGEVDYQTFDGAAQEVLRLNFVPQSVTANGILLPNRADLTQEGWTFDSATGVLRVRHDSAKLIRVSSAILNNNTPPVITLDSPLPGSYVTPVSFTVAATASDADGWVEHVDFLINGSTVATVRSTPYQYDWASVPAGNYELQAVAVDNQGARTSSNIVTVAVSTAPVIVPDVTGLTQAAAAAALANAGLTVGTISTAPSTTVPAGLVISQNPAGGATVSSGSAVALVISSGPPVIVPSVLGLTQAAAATALANAGLLLGNVTTASSTSVPIGLVISQNPAAGTLLPLGSPVAIVVSSGPPVALQVERVVPSADVTGTATTAAFSTSNSGDLLLAFVSADGPANAAQTFTVSGAGLSWALVLRVNTQHGSSEIWKAMAPGTLSNVTVTSTPAFGGYAQSLTVIAFSGAGGTGATAGLSAATGAPSVTLTTTKAGSLVYAAGNDWDNAIARTAGSNQTVVHQWLARSGDTLWVQNRNGNIASAGTAVQINDTAPTNDRWNLAAVEIVPSSVVIVPSVTGMTQAAATAALINAGLAAGDITTALSSTVPAGLVISQNPAGGAVVSAGTSVALVVSLGPAVTVPSVVGSTQATATTTLTNAGLTVGNVTTASSSTVPAGSVIGQNPAAGTQVAAGSAVALVISTGPAPVTVPSVVGSTQAAATTTLTNAGLTVGNVTTASSSTVPAGSVISQNPAAGTQVAPGTAVDLVISSGPVMVAVPSVVGMTQAAATTTLTNAGLTVGNVTTASSSTVPAGSVIGQNPAAGTQVAAGSAVALVISSGPPGVIAVDKMASADGAGTVTTAAFSTSAPAEMLIAFVASDGPASGGQTLTISGGGLTWSLVRRANTQAGTSEIWKAKTTTLLSNVTVRSVQSRSGYRQSLTVITFAGASGTGASAAASGSSGGPSVTLTTTAPNSVVYGVGNDWDRAVTRVVGANQTLVRQWIDSATGDTYWVQARNGAVTSAGSSVQLNDTSPTNDRWNMASVEIIP